MNKHWLTILGLAGLAGLGYWLWKKQSAKASAGTFAGGGGGGGGGGAVPRSIAPVMQPSGSGGGSPGNSSGAQVDLSGLLKSATSGIGSLFSSIFGGSTPANPDNTDAYNAAMAEREAFSEANPDNTAAYDAAMAERLAGSELSSSDAGNWFSVPELPSLTYEPPAYNPPALTNYSFNPPYAGYSNVGQDGYQLGGVPDTLNGGQTYNDYMTTGNPDYLGLDQ
jgi:hypothetical protein